MMSIRRRRAANDRGAILILMSLVLVFLCILVAFAVDFGQARFSRRDNQQMVDLAALSAGFYLSGNGSDTVANQPRAACEAAFSSLLTNADQFTPSVDAVTACAPFPQTNEACDSDPTSPTPTVGPRQTRWSAVHTKSLSRGPSATPRSLTRDSRVPASTTVSHAIGCGSTSTKSTRRRSPR